MHQRSKEQVIAIIRTLQEMRVDRGCTPAEAAHAAAKVAELLDRHQLSLVDVKSKTLNEEMLQRAVRTGRRVRNPGEATLAGAVGAGCDCEVVGDWAATATGGRDVGYNFLGYASDVEVAVYLFETLRDGLLKMADAEARKNPKQPRGAKLVRWRNNFLIGAAGEIRSRLLREKRERHEERRKQAEAEVARKCEGVYSEADVDQIKEEHKVMSLVHLKQPQVRAFAKQVYPKTVQTKCKIGYHYDAIAAGREAGRSISLRKGVEDRPAAQLPGG